MARAIATTSQTPSPAVIPAVMPASLPPRAWAPTCFSMPVKIPGAYRAVTT
ncbi:MAG: hypothetical protein ACYTFI_26520 [Planctomycetota bacterium]